MEHQSGRQRSSGPPRQQRAREYGTQLGHAQTQAGPGGPFGGSPSRHAASPTECTRGFPRALCDHSRAQRSPTWEKMSPSSQLAVLSPPPGRAVPRGLACWSRSAVCIRRLVSVHTSPAVAAPESSAPPAACAPIPTPAQTRGHSGNVSAYPAPTPGCYGPRWTRQTARPMAGVTRLPVTPPTARAPARRRRGVSLEHTGQSTHWVAPLTRSAGVRWRRPP
jgi:hypothetical protein